MHDLNSSTKPIFSSTKPLFSYRPYWAKRFGIAPFLPTSRKEIEELGWDSCDIILVTGDAYVDHPSFGAAVIGRVLEAQGFRVGIISQPNWHSCEDFSALGRPNLFFGITAGNMDSLVNHYTADKKIRSDDAYSPNAKANLRPDRAAIVYAQRCREFSKETPIVLGGIEASLRRLAHYDYWSDKVRRSILVDAKADLLIYGNGERAVVELAHRLAKREPIEHMDDIRGSAFIKAGDHPVKPGDDGFSIHLPSFDQVKSDLTAFAQATREAQNATNPYNPQRLIQPHDNRLLIINPPAIPLTTAELDKIYELPFQRQPHPKYAQVKIPAFEMIKWSIIINRGCFGGCSFCSITEHEGKFVQSRSPESILKEIHALRDNDKSFTGIISDLGGPTANMFQMQCKREDKGAICKRRSCIYPNICPNLNTDHNPLIKLYRKARAISGIKKILIGSGVRYDLALKSPEYIKELVQHHVGGYLKIAPEHVSEGPLSKMLKPNIEVYDKFKVLFEQFSKQAGKEQYLIPYFIAAHPGTTDEDMLEVALWLKKNNFRIDQVQNFLPTPMTLATCMYHTSKDPLKPINETSEKVTVTKSYRKRKLHKAFLRYHDPKNWPLLREALHKMGRDDLIGRGKNCLVPNKY